MASGFLFHRTESHRADVNKALQATVDPTTQAATVHFTDKTAAPLLGTASPPGPSTLVVIYSYGDFNTATTVVRSVIINPTLVIDRDHCVPATKVAAFFKNPFGNLEAARQAPLKIENALITPVPSSQPMAG